MKIPIDAALHVHTPTIVANDPRSLGARRVMYHRRVLADVARARVERVERDAAGRVDASWDARMGVPCSRARRSLSGESLRSEHVDSGWRIALHGAANEPAYAWDARGVTRRFVHDACGRPVAAHEGIGSTRCLERMTYGAASDTTGGAGRLVRHDDTSGTAQVASYSLHGRALAERRRFLSTLDDPDWPEVVADRDRLLETEAFESRWRHDARGTSWQQTDAGGHVRRYALDIAGRPVTFYLAVAGATDRVVSTGAIYDAEGRVTRRRDGDIEMVAHFDPASGHQVGIQRHVAGRAIQDLTYEYDPAGNVTTMTDTASAIDWFDPAGTDPVHRYDYDTLDQLIQATGRESVRVDGAGGLPEPLLPGGGIDNRLRDYVEAYDYDAGGNLVTLAHTASNATVTRRFTIEASSNRAVPVGEEGTIAYDATGNRLHLRAGVPMQWDVRGRLAGVGVSSDEERYVYDAGGMRARKHSTTGDVRYLPGMERRTAANGMSCDVLHLPHAGGLVRIVHWRSGKPDNDVQDLARIQIADLLGSICVEVTTDGTVLSDEAFHPFGSSARWAARDATTAERKLRRYGGKETDSTGLSYYGHRYYAPWLGRWISPDPAGDIDGPNRYRFARNNPCSGIDVDGLFFDAIRNWAGSRSRNDRYAATVRRRLGWSIGQGTAAVELYAAAQVPRADFHRELALGQRLAKRNREMLQRDPDSARYLIEMHLGLGTTGSTDAQWKATRSTLLKGFGLIEEEFGQLLDPGNRRLVLTRPPASSTVADAEAWVTRRDPARHIFLNADRFFTNAVGQQAGILLHELTHQFPRELHTIDLEYFADANDSIKWAHGYAPPTRSFPVANKSPAALMLRRLGPNFASLPEREQVRLAALRNADTWLAIAKDVEAIWPPRT